MSESITAQRIFDTVVEKASTMVDACMNSEGECLYRDSKGSACFVGILLNDDEVPTDGYGNPYIGGVYSLQKAGLLPERLDPYIELLASLQEVHDSPSNWSKGGNNSMIEELKLVAKNHELDNSSVAKHFG